ncbi:hypothetical protein Hanom_Chr14g01256351 [Helianthus anomalus]
MPLGTTTRMRVENVTPAPATSEGIIPSAASETNLSELIFQASVTANVSCTICRPCLQML